MNKHNNESFQMKSRKNQELPSIGEGDYYIENGFHTAAKIIVNIALMVIPKVRKKRSDSQ